MHIEKIVLETKKIKQLVSFYKDVLGVKIIAQSSTFFAMEIGQTIVEFIATQAPEEPYYHVAINIPSNKFAEAKQWAKQLVELTWEDGQDEIIFDSWHAKSCYFDDPAGNIIELISKEKLNRPSFETFSAQSFIDVSEIGLIVTDVEKVGKQLIAEGILRNDEGEISMSNLNFMGLSSVGVYLILSKPGRRWIFSTKKSAVYPLSITLDNNRIIDVLQDGRVVMSKQ
ncbi:VOC family protein [Kurthia sibirica]|nr:VOC family protein [Kurthia sibirica]GEK34591.1 hypothetical protein KSI01_21240 [Kurthia sibirica]